MIMSNGGCSCGGGAIEQSNHGEYATTEDKQTKSQKIRPGLVDREVTMLIAAGAAMAANCEPCLKKIVSDLKEAGTADGKIRAAVITGQFVKDRPAAIMKEAADTLTGTSLSTEPVTDFCPGDEMKHDPGYKVTMLIAAGAAMAANCEPCLNRIVPDLIEAGVSTTDIRRAVEIGQFVKDKPAAIMKEAADVLTGSRLCEKSASVSEGCQADKRTQGAGCCG